MQQFQRGYLRFLKLAAIRILSAFNLMKPAASI
jgi:hypothetical protein